MIFLFLLESFLYRALGLATLLIALWAFSDAVRRKPPVFDAADKRTKGFWLGMTGGSVAVGLLSTFAAGALLPFTLVALVAACVYLADVKPSVSGSGPYGRW